MADKVELDPSDDFDKLLIELRELHHKKKADYSDPRNRFSNFEYAALAAGVTTSQVFEVMIGIKQARLIELMKPNRVAQNESLSDTKLDRIVYCILDLIYYRLLVDKK